MVTRPNFFVQKKPKNKIWLLKEKILKEKYFAHSLEGRPVDEWHVLEDHFKCTAELAKSFADTFGSGEWVYLAGLWHDLGKYSEGESL
ncbi:MAG: CRISPR-associated helicase [Candidatus Scalindua rubra]|uniref:CRISPR-associated helicase n=1 Tax=Candidatus Scalindua rubra TaxID=1872076 RepID=A0A1E3XEI2_9BACT|nr:MAG: CRISPR-associated helicase [Candidatus Scalindua rubra]